MAKSFAKPVLVVLVVALCASLVASGVAAAQDLPRVLRIGTNPLGSLLAVTGTALANLIANHTPIDARAVPTDGATTWMPMFLTGEMDLGVTNTYDAYMGWRGEDVFGVISGGKGFPLRTVVMGSPLVVGILVRGDSDIHSSADLRGRRYVTTFSYSGAVTALAQGFLANYGYTVSDVLPVVVPGITEGVQALIEGRADAAAAAITIPAARELDAAHGARFLGMDPSLEAVRRFQQHFPVGYPLEVRPAPNLVGIDAPAHYAAYDSSLVARADLSEAAVYEVTKALWNHYEELGEVHPDLRNWTPASFLKEEFAVPYHPGAVRFYREQGVWTDAMEVRQRELLAQGN